MKRFAGLVCAVIAAAVFFAACSKDKDSGKFVFDSPAVFLQPGEQSTVRFSAFNIRSISVSDKPDGWSDPVIDAGAGTVTITAPSEFGDEVAKTGSLVLSATPHEGSALSASIFVGVVASEDLSAKPANSYVVDKPETNYLFSAMHRGDVMAVLPASVAVVWQSMSNLIQYVQLSDDKVSFYVGADSDDAKKIKEGNAVIGAYDAGGSLIWSWHVWAVNYDPETADNQVDFNGFTMMDRNLGALADDNSSAEKILASYGLYYQWGRKDPFIGPSKYDAADGASASMYNGGGSRVYLKTVVSDAGTGTREYAVANPLTFIVGASGSQYDWLWSAHADDLWSASSKTVNDPCPYGWRVAPAAAFDGLSIKEPLADVTYEPYYDKFGWTLTDGAAESLFIGAGRRIYRHIQENDTQGGGSIQNFYPTPVEGLKVRNAALYNQPWVGYYWTASTDVEAKSQALYFWFDKSDVAASGIRNATPQFRANGMSVRCVKDK